ncbi:hypothetical protein [Pedobacter arcticus]|uniref:hypothetical protein n=1 Tax=Pedobacter arcticus TaxID=752140 RepID=UPI0002D6E054|nr:hypothetical protein [Pedobacter arcticus]
MVEVFSTNVKNHKEADFLLNQLCELFPVYEINFDLDDCDNILRVKSDLETIEVFKIVDLLNNFGFSVQVLVDTTELFSYRCFQ